MAKKAARPKQYWLFKTEPGSFSIDDLAASENQSTFWDGVRNYQARNMIRDDMRVGDRVFIYHSNAKPMAIVGTARITKAAYPDHTAFDENEKHFDAKSSPDDPTWFMVDIKLTQKFKSPVTRDDLKAASDLAEMMVLKKGSRLSIQPVTEAEWKRVHELAGAKPK
ncbi:EVE domain protein [Thalassoglobus neptunius]|uniref:EVE domain protein n=1 Tax=Thalassoglobus neptunius TaxID=1938619 RepID=A0A5C5WZT4_9PLAN|nr:EVE domain-containing protein [Thalassoglobus neptunius]TWT55435.1 EVE domain protein [Thalassoglobus neptunius]